MLYAHFKYSDKPLMGSVTAPERAADSIAMAQLVFGEAFVDANACLLSLINVNSPLAFDATMLGALEVYAAANQAVIVSPFLIAGAMAPTTTAGVMVQASAEALVGLAHTQLVRPGAPAIFRYLRGVHVDAIRRAHLWDARACADHVRHGADCP